MIKSSTDRFLSLVYGRMEMEADYIGLLFMASVGYDPRIAPRVYEKMGKVAGDSTLKDYLSTHPSGKRELSCWRKPKSWKKP